MLPFDNLVPLGQKLPLFPPYTGPKPTLLPAIKALPAELRENIWIKLLDFYSWSSQMPDLIIAIRRCRAEKTLYEELLALFYREIIFKLQILNDWKLNGFASPVMKYVRKLEIQLPFLRDFPITLTPSSLAEQTELMPNLQSVHLIMSVDFPTPPLKGPINWNPWTYRGFPLAIADLPTWLTAFKAVKVLAITFEIWKEGMRLGLRIEENKTEDQKSEGENHPEETIPEWFEEQIKFVEERVKHKASRRQTLPRYQFDLTLRWTAEDGKALDFSDASEELYEEVNPSRANGAISRSKKRELAREPANLAY